MGLHVIGAIGAVNFAEGTEVVLKILDGGEVGEIRGLEEGRE